MIVQQPISFRKKKNPDITRLYFERGESLDFYLMGAIAWPEVLAENSYFGLALMGGQEVKSKKVRVFDEFEFATIDHWEDAKGSIRKKTDTEAGVTDFWYGLTHFFNQILGQYGCTGYFWGGQHAEIFQRYGLQAYRSDMSPQGLYFNEIHMVKEAGDNLIAEYLNFDKLILPVISKRTLTNTILYQHMKAGGIVKRPGWHALKVLLAGFESWPVEEYNF